MGGHKAGAYASLLAAKTVLDCFIDAQELHDNVEASAWLYQAIIKANKNVKEKSEEDDKFSGMGTTLAITLVLKNSVLIANVGDSRVYQYHNNKIIQITEDQTLVNVLLKSGKITKEEAVNHPNKHVLMYAIGTMEHPKIDIYELKKEPSVFLMCSDGIYNLVSQAYLKTILASSLPISQKAISIIDDANNNGGYDNMSIVLLEVN